MKSPFRYAGGKQLLAPLIVDLIPRHKVYVEPFFGAGSVFFSQKSEIEVVNDLNGDLIAFYRCLQDKVKYEELQHRLNFTLYHRAEYYRADDILFGGGKHSDIDRAWAFFVCASQSFGAMVKPNIGWGVGREKKGHPSVFTGKISTLSKYHERLRNAYIDNRDAIECMKQWDTADTFFYLDPPYHNDTCDAVYSEGLNGSVEFQQRLVQYLLTVKGKVILSGYANEDYAALESAGWERKDVVHKMSLNAKEKNKDRIESIWMNFHTNISPLFK